MTKDRTRKKPPSGAPDMGAYAEDLGRARSRIGISHDVRIEVSAEAPWRSYHPVLNEACAEMFRQGERHFAPRVLGFTPADMIEDGRRLQQLSTAEEMLTAEIRDVRAEKERVRRRIISRTGTIMTSVRCRLEDPQTDPADRQALAKLAARPQAILAESAQAMVAKKKLTEAERARADAAEAIVGDKDLEIKVLKGEPLTLQDVAAARRRGARRTPR